METILLRAELAAAGRLCPKHWPASSPRRSRREEFDEMIVDAVGRFLLQVVAGRERLRIDEVAREPAPHRGKFLGRRCASRSPQYQERHPDLAILVGRIHLEIDRGA